MAKLNFTMHPHGLSYIKSSEGSIYKDNSMNGMDRAVPPGATYTYTWKINPENGPTKGDQPCIPSVYHSHIAVPHDINTGLIGRCYMVFMYTGKSALEESNEGRVLRIKAK